MRSSERWKIDRKIWIEKDRKGLVWDNGPFKPLQLSYIERGQTQKISFKC